MIIFIEEFIGKLIVWCLRCIDYLKEIVEGIFSKTPFLKNGEEINLMSTFIENNTIKYLFWVIFILSIGIICIFTIISLVRNMLINNQNVTKIIGKFLMSIISMLIILAFFIISILITNELYDLLCSFLNNESNVLLSEEVFNLLVGEWQEGYSIDNFNIDLITNTKLFGDYGYFINNIWPSDFLNNGIIDHNSFNFILGIVVAILLLISFLKIIFILFKRIFKIIFLYITLPLSLSTLVLDDGKRLNKWKDEVIEELVSFFLIFLGYNIMSIIMPIILQLSFINEELTNTIKLLLIVVGYFIVPSCKNLFKLINGDNKKYIKVINNNVSHISTLDASHRYVDVR